MGQRLIRVNELLKREISKQLHTHYRSECVGITITGVNTSPDLRHTKVLFSVFGDKQKQREAGRFFAKYKKEIRYRVGNEITLKYLPRLDFMQDHSLEKDIQLLEFMDNLKTEEENK